MKEKFPVTYRSGCPINILLETLGDTWSLLIVRDMMFFGRTTYNEFLNAGEKIATNILSDRLQRLEAADIIEKRRDPADARKFIYRLTERGIDLAPMLVEMILWSATHEETDAPPEAINTMSDDREAFINRARENWRSASTSQNS
ncbi:MAG: transcriptional regulator hxlr family [Gallionellaceae bacterium]|nr:MAG: transcriptional regulator hxlr family [Gallionellaceae bacterium]